MAISTKQIMLWMGTLATIPAGWQLCDGTNGTPDLRGKFMRAGAEEADLGVTGGSDTHTHTGGSAVAVGNHSHSFSGSTSGGPSSSMNGTGTTTQVASGGHTHSIPSTGTGNGGAHGHGTNDLSLVTALPSFINMFMIMKVA